MQSAKGKTKRWVLDWDVLSSAGRWENPLIGWASSADYMQGTNVFFRTKEDAIAFVSGAGRLRNGRVGCTEKLTLQAEKQGWDYYVQTPHKPKIPPKNYGTMYPYRPVLSLTPSEQLRPCPGQVAYPPHQIDWPFDLMHFDSRQTYK